MAEEQGEEKTEEPTSRRLSQARERGELPRSPDFGGAVEVLAVCGLIFFIGDSIVDGIAEMLRQSLSFSRGQIEDVDDLAALAGQRIFEGLWAVKWILLTTLVVSLLASIVNGGFNFSAQAAAPKLSKLNPLNGLKRIFGAQAWMGLLRNLLKFSVIAAVLVGVLWTRRFEMLALARDALEPMIEAGTSLALMIFTLVSVAVAAIAIVDVPYQRWNYLRRLRMTKQEVRDEMKDIEGRPEVKRQIRRKQRELSRGKMLEKVRDADVVIVNPSEFAVALEYDEARNPVPILLAKGRGEIAAAIKEQAKRAGVPLVSSPPLARAIYFTTELDREVPEGLYRAVAAVLAYVFRLSALTPGLQIPEVPQAKLPPEFTFDEDGNSPTGRPA
ncbi:MAG: flagellar biosynthesis protein FlhB [Gammaproteobacteria bacterium]|jgi:flagellar biosynthetic protein FlhB|nr:flagellar biosynthesis protein FlhB [Gammaproteobacteria bacterium]NDE87320.1 flagellar biosynthesis protein FlhB [Gammaproteobacteria bacterium]